MTIFGAGRTDAGVHAMGQVAHFDINNKELEPFVIKNALNDHLRPFPIAILEVDKVDSTFHARFNALQRKYLYRIVNRKSPLTIEKGRAWHVHKDIEVDPMKECISLIEGKHDFTTFRSAHCQSDSPIKTIDSLKITKSDENILQEFTNYAVTRMESYEFYIEHIENQTEILNTKLESSIFLYLMSQLGCCNTESHKKVQKLIKHISSSQNICWIY